MNAPECDAVHITEIETNVECDTFIPAVDKSIFQPWYSSFPVVEKNLRYSFNSYVRVRSSAEPPIDQNNGLVSHNKPDFSNFEAKFSFLPKEIFERHEEYLYLKLVQEIISDGIPKDDRTGTGTLSKFGCQVTLSYYLEYLFNYFLCQLLYFKC